MPSVALPSPTLLDLSIGKHREPDIASSANPEVGSAERAQWELLDDPDEWTAFGRPCQGAGTRWESSVVLEGMHCAACAITIEDTLLAVPGVISAQVGAASRRASVVWDSAVVHPSGWMQAVLRAGYRAVPANDRFILERRKAETRQALWRWLVAGLCMMQVMMYAYPAYIASPGDLSSEMEQLLRWASWVLTLPVLLFSCGPFFSNSWRDVVLRRVSMDLPVAIGIFITFAVSTAGTFDPQGRFGREVYFDSLTMFVFFLLTGRWLELRMRDRTAGALEALMNRLPDSAQRRNVNGAFEIVAVRRIVVGDVLRILPGQVIPADGVVESGNTLVDEALLTGESTPVPRGRNSQVVAGSHNLSATIQVRVQKAGADTRFAQIVALMQSASSSRPALAMLADRLAKPFLMGVLLTAAAACFWWWGTDPAHALMVAASVLVVTCPCALSLATPAAVLAAAGSMARAGVMVRKLGAMEALAAVDTVVFDKTGTLTRDAFAISRVIARQGISVARVERMAAAVALHSHHPVSRAIAALEARSQGGGVEEAWQCEAATEMPGQGVIGTATLRTEAGILETVQLRLGSAAYCGVASDTGPGMRAYLADASGWLATFEVQEEVRGDAAEAIAALQHSGIQVVLLSGDREQSVQRVAQQLGIKNAFSGCSPVDKLAQMGALQAQGHVVAMVGDGLNDGPVLAGASVSFAFGRSVPIAQAQADFVVPGDSVMHVFQTLLLSRRTMRVVRQNLLWALIYNMACVPLAVAGMLPAWAAGLGMATSSLVVVLNAMRLSRGMGRGLAAEPEVP